MLFTKKLKTPCRAPKLPKVIILTSGGQPGGQVGGHRGQLPPPCHPRSAAHDLFPSAGTAAIDFAEVLKHELAPLSTSMFKDDGEMRIATTKSDLKRQL